MKEIEGSRENIGTQHILNTSPPFCCVFFFDFFFFLSLFGGVGIGDGSGFVSLASSLE